MLGETRRGGGRIEDGIDMVIITQYQIYMSFAGEYSNLWYFRYLQFNYNHYKGGFEWKRTISHSWAIHPNYSMVLIWYALWELWELWMLVGRSLATSRWGCSSIKLVYPQSMWWIHHVDMSIVCMYVCVCVTNPLSIYHFLHDLQRQTHRIHHFCTLFA